MDKKLSVEMLRMQDFQFNEEEMIVLCGGRSTNETSSEIEDGEVHTSPTQGGLGCNCGCQEHPDLTNEWDWLLSYFVIRGDQSL